MCFLITLPESKIATKPIKVYKVFYLKTEDGKLHLSGVCYPTPYKLNRIMVAQKYGVPIKELGVTKGKTMYDEGFHSALKEDFFDVNKGIALAWSIMMECEIPKGTEYMINARDEVISTKIKIKKYVKTYIHKILDEEESKFVSKLRR